MRYSSNLTWYLKILPSQTSKKFSVGSETNILYLQITQKFVKLQRAWLAHAWAMARTHATECNQRLTDHSAFTFKLLREPRSLKLGSFQIISFSLWFYWDGLWPHYCECNSKVLHVTVIDPDSQISIFLSRLSLSVLSLLGFFWG